mmetsp:Transcript_33385/g.92191  ORF Transcript_33385/g.92191 Transcript_33385/m.92191 type:complete len:467 (-) Transcript_33385:87-1487(-)
MANASRSSKIELHDRERELSDADERIKQLKSVEIPQAQSDVVDRKTLRMRYQGELSGFRDQRTKAVQSQDHLKRELEFVGKEKEHYAKVLEDIDAQGHSERHVQTAAEAVHDHIGRTVADLRAVHDEIMMLASDAARQAALAFAGGDLPEEAVPPPVKQVPLERNYIEQLWKGQAGIDMGEAKDSVTREVQVSLQSQAVLAALQRSLCICAADLREGLRQWSFARNATARTAEMNSGFAMSTAESDSQRDELVLKREQLVKGQCEDALALRDLQEEHSELQNRHRQLVQELSQESDGVEQLKAQRLRVLAAIDETTRSHDTLKFDYAEVCRSLEATRIELQNVPLESARRMNAAEKLALQSEEQARRSSMQLEHTQQELSSFTNAHNTLRADHTTLGHELEALQRARAELKDDHEILGQDLNALAQHYMALLPDLPGLELNLSPRNGTHHGATDSIETQSRQTASN